VTLAISETSVALVTTRRTPLATLPHLTVRSLCVFPLFGGVGPNVNGYLSLGSYRRPTCTNVTSPNLIPGGVVLGWSPRGFWVRSCSGAHVVHGPHGGSNPNLVHVHTLHTPWPASLRARVGVHTALGYCPIGHRRKKSALASKRVARISALSAPLVGRGGRVNFLWPSQGSSPIGTGTVVKRWCHSLLVCPPGGGHTSCPVLYGEDREKY
jgi:hypothetical protein